VNKGPEVFITKRQVVLMVDHEFTSDGDVMFVYPDDEPGKEALHMPIQTWRHMGEPPTITVTITPGDQFND
jgi:hypothetical protein